MSKCRNCCGHNRPTSRQRQWLRTGTRLWPTVSIFLFRNLSLPSPQPLSSTSTILVRTSPVIAYVSLGRNPGNSSARDKGPGITRYARGLAVMTTSPPVRGGRISLVARDWIQARARRSQALQRRATSAPHAGGTNQHDVPRVSSSVSQHCSRRGMVPKLQIGLVWLVPSAKRNHPNDHTRDGNVCLHSTPLLYLKSVLFRRRAQSTGHRTECRRG